MRRVLLTLTALILAQIAMAQCTLSWSVAPDPQPGAPFNVQMTNSSSVVLIPGSLPYMTVQWGDGNTGAMWYNTSTNTFSAPSHNYSGPGTYVVTVGINYYDSVNMVQVCNNSGTQTITVSPSPCYTTISVVDNGSGSYDFTANSTGSGLSYAWDFGDGNTGIGGTPSHTYAASGSYSVSVVATGSGCTYTAYTTINYFNGSVICSGLSASFTYSNSANSFYFTNTSTPLSAPGAFIYSQPTWDFGDGNSSNQWNPGHSYSAGGSYTVTLYNYWIDSTTNMVLCSDTISQGITVPNPPNEISGNIFWDSLSTGLFTGDFKVWLIVHDAGANTLTAVDSLTTSGMTYASYLFSGAAAGDYLVKAQMTNAPVGVSGPVPTYHYNSLYWGGANTITHTGGSSTNNNILMQTGTVTSGPGFIAGNISLGAGKGTSTGVAGMLVFLRDDADVLVSSTYTNIDGDYSFANLPIGNYTVYPEAINYETIPSYNIAITGSQTTVSDIDFEQTEDQIIPILTGIANVSEAIFGIAPNPSHGIVNISFAKETGKAYISVADMTGRKVYSNTVNTADNARLDLSGMQSGVYFIKIETNKTQHTEKLLIRH